MSTTKKSTPVKSSVAKGPAPLRRAGAAKPAGKPAAAKPAAAAGKGTPAAAAAAPKKEPEVPAKHITINSKQIANILINDDDRQIRDHKKAVLVVDNDAGIAGRFLPYSGANTLEAMSPSNMEPERIRMALLGAVRHKKPLSVDLGDCGVDMFDVLRMKFDEVQPGLLEKCMNRAICTREVYESLLKDTDDDTLKVESYYDFENEIADKFIMEFVMKNAVYPKDFTKQFFMVTVE